MPISAGCTCRTDIISDEEKINNDVELIRGLNPTAEIITTPVSELSGEKLLSIMEKRDGLLSDLIEEARKEAAENEHHHHHHDHDHDHEDHDDHEGHEHCHHDHDEHEHCHHDHDEHEQHHHEHHDGEECCCGHHHHHHDGHDADEIFDSWGKENVAPISREKLESILQGFSGSKEFGEIIRSKGMVESADEKGAWYYFDFVPGEYEIRAGEPEHTGKVCVIGRELDTDKLNVLF